MSRIAGRWSREEELDDRLPEMLAWFAEAGEVGSLEGQGGVRLAYYGFPAEGARGAIVLVPGWSEASEKYVELAWDLRGRGYGLWMLDHRGQGRSQRLLGTDAPDDPLRRRGHVDSFADYVHDLERFLGEVVRPQTRGPLFLAGHSMGGAVAARFAQRAPGEVDGLVLLSPMLDIGVGFAARRLIDLMVLRGRGAEFAWGEGRFDPEAWRFEDDRNTSSEARFRLKRTLYLQRPELVVAGVTWGWVQAACRALAELRLHGPRLTAPTLLFQAGADQTVRPAGQDALVARAPRATRVVVPGACHELLFERDPIRDDVLDRTLAFLEGGG